MGEEDVVVIPIQVEVQDSNSTTEYLAKLKGHLDQIKQMMSADNKGNNMLKKTQEEAKMAIANIEELSRKLGDVMKSASDSNRGTQEMFKLYSDMRRGLGEYKNVTQEQVEAQKEMWQTMKNANAEEQANAQKTADTVTDEINQKIKSLYELARAYSTSAKYARESGKAEQASVLGGAGAEGNKLNNTGTPFQAQAVIEAINMERDAEREAEKASEEATKAAKEHEAATKREIAVVKQSAGQYYYKLRAVKMFGFVINEVTSSIDSFGKKMADTAKKGLSAYIKLIPGVNALAKAFSRASNSQKSFNRELGKTHKSHEDFKQSLGDAVKMFLKYGLGIRSLFVLFNRLRHSMVDGLGQLSQKYSEVNQQMSSVVSSMNQMKAAVTSVVQPLLNVLAPALEKIAAVVADIAYKVASFIAALTGQSFVFKATRQQVDYAKSLDKTAKAAKEANKELGKYDKLNVIQQNKDNGGKDDGGVGAMGFEKVPIDSKMKNLADAFKKFLNRLLGPIKKAWDKMKDFVKKGWKYALDELLKLGKSVARDFWRVWEEPETQKIFENIFKIIGDIGFIVGNLAKNFRIAWDTCENGYRILKAIRDVILIISEGAVQIADYMVIWSDNLSFIPLLTTLADVMEQKLVPAVQKVTDLFVYLFNEIFLKLVKDFIESGLPQVLRIAGNLVEAVGNLAENIRNALKDGNRGVEIVTRIEDLIQIVANHIESASEKTAEWAKNVDFVPLLESAKTFLEQMQPVIDFISGTLEKLWTNVLLPFWKYLIEQGFPKLLDMLGELSSKVNWDELKGKVDTFLSAFEKFLELAWETLIEIIEKLGEKLVDFLNSDALQQIVDKFEYWVDNADPEELADKIITLTEAILGIKAALHLASVATDIWTKSMTLVNLLLQTKMIKTVGELTTTLGSSGAAASGAAGALGEGGFAGALGAIAVPALIVTAVVLTMTAAFGGLDGLVKAVGEQISDAGKRIKEFAEAIGFTDAIDRLKEKFTSMNESLEKLRPLFDLILEVLKGLVVIIVNTVIGALTGLLHTLSGIFDFIGGIGDILGGIIKLLQGDFTGAIKSIGEGLIGIFVGAVEAVGGLGEAIIKAIDGILSMIPGWNGGISGFVDSVVGFFANMKYQLIGDPIVYDIRDGIIDAFVEFIKETVKNVQDWVKNIIDKFTALGKDILTSIKTTWTNVLNETKNSWNKFKSSIATHAREAINKFKSEFSASKLVSIGKNFIGGLIDGIKQKASSLMSTISDVCSDAVSAVKSAFQIHSPSRVMREIGEYIMEGLAIGVEDEADKDLIPLGFMDSFLAALTDMSLDAIDIVTNMVNELDDRLSDLVFMENLSSQLNKISSIKVPDIAVGSVLPSNIAFKQSSNALDEKTLNRLIREAVGDIVSSINTDSNKAPIMLQLDSRTVAEAVWDEEEKRYKQRGDYKPFYT